MTTPDLTFTPLSPAHLPLLHQWLQLPHVRAFWDDGDRTPEQVAAHYLHAGRDVDAFIFTLNREPAGYIQAYPVGPGSEFAAWRAPVGETSGIDLFIGAPVWLGKGQAVHIIQAFIEHLHQQNPNLRRVLIDPETRNARARHVYARAGFQPLETMAINGKELALMVREVEP